MAQRTSMLFKGPNRGRNSTNRSKTKFSCICGDLETAGLFSLTDYFEDKSYRANRWLKASIRRVE